MGRGSIVRGSMFVMAVAGSLLLGFAFHPIHARSTDPATLTPLRFRQSFIPTESYIPDEVALYKKFYEAQGLAVEMLGPPEAGMPPRSSARRTIRWALRAPRTC
jgi:ABC-type nitrate/sulfonate/bicarbonate transport system substrate-binding protein